MNVLTVPVSHRDLDKILSGEKQTVVRPIRPNLLKYYFKCEQGAPIIAPFIEWDEEGFPLKIGFDTRGKYIIAPREINLLRLVCGKKHENPKECYFTLKSWSWHHVYADDPLQVEWVDDVYKGEPIRYLALEAELELGEQAAPLLEGVL